jgi:hypothetical protein
VFDFSSIQSGESESKAHVSKDKDIGLVNENDELDSIETLKDDKESSSEEGK